jgi:hypothetical protein
MRKSFSVALLTAAFALTTAASAQAINLTYDFAGGDQGWTSSQSNTGNLDPVSWDLGGFIKDPDTGAETGCPGSPCNFFFFVSPGVPAGSMAANYGGSISFDVGSDEPAEFAGVAYIDVPGGQELRRLFPTSPSAGFQRVTLPLTESGWTLCPTYDSDDCNPNPSAAEFRAVLAGAQYTDILTDIVDGTGETYILDNFRIAEPPPPPAPPVPAKKKKCKKKKGKKRALAAKKKCKKKKKKGKKRILEARGLGR